ncbi:MAG: hypothetical protein ABSH56_03530 [Bryobacteraceae bacterium]|jgi:hypothetical protein
MTKFVLTSAVTFAVLGVLSATATAGDLSKYRDFQFGTDLATVAKQAGTNPSDVKAIHSRPALIQELEWRPQSLGASSQTESAQQVVFSFYDGQLFSIAVNYDRYETEGLTTNDLVEAVSATYGPATLPAAPSKAVPGSYGDQEEVLATWQDSLHRFDLVRAPYGRGFKLVGVLKAVEIQAQSANAEADRLDLNEAPQREAERLAKDSDIEQARLDKARLVNKSKFRP